MTDQPTTFPTVAFHNSTKMIEVLSALDAAATCEASDGDALAAGAASVIINAFCDIAEHSPSMGPLVVPMPPRAIAAVRQHMPAGCAGSVIITGKEA